MDNNTVNRRFDYLAPKRDLFGVYLCGVGMRISPPGAAYQVYESGAPFQWRNGRRLRDYMITFITRGRGFLQYSKRRRVEVQAGDIMLIPPGMWHDYAPDPGTGWRELWISINGRQTAKLVAQAKIPKSPPVIHCGVDGELHRLFTQMFELAESMPPLVESIHAGMAIQAVSLLQSLAQSGRDKLGGAESFVQKAKRRMMVEGGGETDVERLARELCVSYTKFRRGFKESVGMSPHQYLINLKLTHAKRLLENPERKLDDIAREVGFSDPFYFSRLFKRKTGISPSHWRN